MSTPAELLKAFRLQSGWCRDYGSPFTADLIAVLADDLEAGGPVHDIVGNWPGEALPDAVSLRLAGALHALALSGRDTTLTAAYPAANPSWTIDQVWPLARAALIREEDFFRTFIQNAPQTNETRRTIGLLPGFLRAAAVGPLHLLEIGASAGLNQQLDGFRFETAGWSYGPSSGPLIDTDWQAPPPEGLDRPLVIASRAGCDINPLDIRDEAQRTRLISYVWADQPERLARIDRAIALAKEKGTPPVKADAAAFLKQRLSGQLPNGTTVVFHSVVWQYLPETTKQGALEALAASAQTAGPQNRLAWLRYEPNRMLEDASAKGFNAADGFGVAMTLWPGGKTERLLSTDGHTRAITIP